MSLFLLQDPETTPEKLEEVVSEEKTLSIFNLIMEGGLGGQIIIALLFILLLIGFLAGSACFMFLRSFI